MKKFAIAFVVSLISHVTSLYAVGTKFGCSGPCERGFHCCNLTNTCAKSCKSKVITSEESEDKLLKLKPNTYFKCGKEMKLMRRRFEGNQIYTCLYEIEISPKIKSTESFTKTASNGILYIFPDQASVVCESGHAPVKVVESASDEEAVWHCPDKTNKKKGIHHKKSEK